MTAVGAALVAAAFPLCGGITLAAGGAAEQEKLYGVAGCQQHKADNYADNIAVKGHHNNDTYCHKDNGQSGPVAGKFLFHFSVPLPYGLIIALGAA